MNKQVLSPFDCDMCAMIEDITKQEIEVTASDTSIRLSWAQNGSEGNDRPEAQRIEALKQAIRGRLGDRFIEFFYADGRQSVYMKYDPEEYPEEMRTRLTDPDATAGTRYCRTLLEVDAIQFRRDNVDDVLRFTEGGTVTTPRTPDGKAMFSFPDGNGIFVDVPESWYIIRELNGRFTARPERDFKREFEPKNNPVENTQKEPTNKGCGDCSNFMYEDVNGNGYCEAFKSEQGAGIYVAKNINPKNNRAMKEKSFAQELAALINRHGIDAKMNTNDWILADVAIDALNAYGKANQLREKMANAPEPGKDDCDCPACTLRRTLQGKAQPGGKEYRKPEAFDVPKEVEAMAAFFADMFPGPEIQIQRVDLKKNPRNKCRAKNKRKGGRRNKK